MKSLFKKIILIMLIAACNPMFFACGKKENKEVAKTAVGEKQRSEKDESDRVAEKNNELEAYASKIIEGIDGEYVYKVIEELASEKYNGRLTGTPGNMMAAEYIKEQFKEIGIESFSGVEDYFQNYKQSVPYMKKAPVIEIVDESGKVVDRILYRHEFLSMLTSSYDNVGDEIGKIVYLKKERGLNKGKIDGNILVVNNRELNSGVIEKIEKGELKPDAILVDASSNYRGEQVFKKPVNFYGDMGSRSNNDHMPLYAFLNKKGMDKILNYVDGKHGIRISVNFYAEEKEIPNVLGMIEGSDKSDSREYLVISGHFDHLGSNYDGTYNPGASDNASGIACMLELAKIIKENNMEFEETIIFAAFNGEENGLYGSKYFAKNSGIDMRSVTMLNIDMVANINDGPINLVADKRTDFFDSCMKIAEDMGLECEEELNAPYSDHDSIEKNGGKAVSIVEIEFQDYHTPKDDMEIIDKEELREIVELSLRIILSIK